MMMSRSKVDMALEARRWRSGSRISLASCLIYWAFSLREVLKPALDDRAARASERQSPISEGSSVWMLIHNGRNSG